MRFDRTTWIAAVAFAALVASPIPPAKVGGVASPRAAQAQNLGQRVVSGSVVDANGAPVAGATVFLKDMKTKSIRSYTSSERGRFRFAQVNMSTDFDLWAEKDTKKSETKTVSYWDARKEFEVDLKMK